MEDTAEEEVEAEAAPVEVAEEEDKSKKE